MSAVTAAVNVLDPHSLLSSFGPFGVGVVLFTAGVLAAAPASASLHLPLGWVVVCAAIGACLAAQTGYWIGRRAGPALFDPPRRARLREARNRAVRYLARYGYGKAIVLARFVPVVRTVLNPTAGVVGIPARTFTLWQIIGGLIWSLGVALAGYLLGSHISNVDHYLVPIIAVIILASLVPIGAELLRAGRASRDAAP